MKPLVARLALALTLFVAGSSFASAQSIDQLIADLTGLDEKARLEAAGKLAEMGPAAEPAVPALTESLDRDDLVLQHECIIALGRIGAPAAPAVGELSKLLGGRSEILAHEAIHSLRLIGPASKPALPRLKEIAKDRDPRKSVAATWAIAEIAPDDPIIPSLVPALVEHLDDPSQDVRNDTVSAVAAIGKPAVNSVAAKIGVKGPEMCFTAADALAEIGPDAEAAVPKLIKSLDDKDDRVCWHVARALGAIGAYPDRVVPALIAKLDADSAPLRANSALALGRFGEAAKPAVGKLIPMLKDDDPQIRVIAARTLGSIGPGAGLAVPALDDALEDEVGSVTVAAAEALGNIGKGAVPVLADRLKNEDLRPLVAAVLGEIGPDAVGALPALLKLLDAEEREVRVEAILAISNMGSLAKNAAAPVLMKRLELPKDESRAGAIYALAKIGAGESVPRIRKLLDTDDDPRVKLAASWALVTFEPDNEKLVAEALPTLKQGLTDDWELIRRESLSAIGMAGKAAKSAVPDVAKLLEDENPEVRAEALHTLTEIGASNEMVGNAARAALDDRDPMVRATGMYAIGTIGKPAAAAVPAIEKMLAEERDPLQKTVAAWTLVKIDPSPEHKATAIPLLAEAILKARRPGVRIKVAETLGEIGKGSDVARAALREATRDPVPEVQEAAKKALANL